MQFPLTVLFLNSRVLYIPSVWFGSGLFKQVYRFSHFFICEFIYNKLIIYTRLKILFLKAEFVYIWLISDSWTPKRYKVRSWRVDNVGSNWKTRYNMPSELTLKKQIIWNMKKKLYNSIQNPVNFWCTHISLSNL